MSYLKHLFLQIREVWNTYELDLVNYQNKCRLIRGWDDLFNKVKEHINSVSAMKLSPYYKVKWKTKLKNYFCLPLLFSLYFCQQGLYSLFKADRLLIVYAYFVTLKKLFPLIIISSQTLDNIKMNINAVFKLQVFEEDALSWEDKLNRIMALFDVWIDVQRRWVYLEGIFTGSADIKHLLPVETQRFQR